MSYTKTTWSDGDIITANKMNNIETGVESLNTDVGQLQTDLDSLTETVTDLPSGGDYQELVDDVSDIKADLDENINDLKGAISDNADRVFDMVTNTTNRNKWNPDEAATDKALSNASATLGQLVDNNGYTTSGFIPVVKGNTVQWYYTTSSITSMAIGSTAMRIAEYKADGTCLLVTAAWLAFPYTVQNDDTALLRMTVQTKAYNMVIVDDSNIAVKPYIKYEAGYNGAINIRNELMELIGIQTSLNKWNPTNAKADTAISNSIDTLGQLVANSGYTTSGFIPANKGDTIQHYYTSDSSGNVSISNTALRIGEYDSEGNCLRVTAGWPTLPYTVQNSNTAFVRLATVTKPYNMIIVNDTNISQKAFIKYAINYNLLRDVANQAVRSYAHLVTPTWIPAVVGVPSCLYYENLIADGMLKDYHVQRNLPRNGIPNYYRIDSIIDVPTSSGDETINLTLMDKHYIIEKKTVIKHVVNSNASGSAKVLIIGDSKSAATKPWEILDGLLENDSAATITFLGTVTDGPIRREAYSGKNVINVCDDEYITGTTPNIFYDSSVTTTNGHHFSFSKGVTALGATPDIVVIDHGANQWGTEWATIKGCYDDMIASIHSVNSSIKIVVVVQEGTGLLRRPTYSTNGKWWLDNTTGTNAELMLDEYNGREDENIYIMPSFVCVDLYQDFPICKIPAVEGLTGDVDVCMDSVHPGLNNSTWAVATEYKYGAWVKLNGVGYGCKKACTGVNPSEDNGTYWAACKNLGDGYIKKGWMYYSMLKYLLTV